MRIKSPGRGGGKPDRENKTSREKARGLSAVKGGEREGGREGGRK